MHAPGRRDAAAAIAATHHLLLAHGRGSRALREVLGEGASIGIVLNPAPVRPLTDAAEDREAVALADGLRNRVWLEPLARGRYPDDVLSAWEPLADLSRLHRPGDLAEIAAPVDLLGVNYYTPVWVGRRTAEHEPGAPRPAGPGQDHLVQLPGPPPHTQMGWSIDATGLEELLLRLARELPGVPLAVTENGGAFPDHLRDGVVDDQDRIAYLDAHLRAAVRAAGSGVDLRVFLVWTLLDNYE